MSIQFKNIHKQFGQKVIFDNLSFQVLPGERALFQGPSGIGKTTLFYLILGFETPDSGQILFQEQALTPTIIQDLRQNVAYVPQIIELGQGTIADIMEEFMSFQVNTPITNWKEQLPDLLETFDLAPDLLTKHFSMLSGGERQRLAIIIAILLDRKIFLLDEPTAGLDEAGKQKVIQYFSQRKDLTLVIISHDKEWEQLDAIKIITLEK